MLLTVSQDRASLLIADPGRSHALHEQVLLGRSRREIFLLMHVVLGGLLTRADSYGADCLSASQLFLFCSLLMG